MAKKKSSGAVRLLETVIAAPGECLDRPAENNVHADDVVVVDIPQPTPGTSSDEVAADARNKS
jgi:hypothetical protein